MVDLSYRLFFATALLAGLGQALPAAAQTPAGMLECNISGSTGAVVTSSKALACVFHPVDGPPELYDGTLTTIGLDVGFTNAGKLSWGVAIADVSPRHYPLVGTYTGATAGATAGAGVGANTLVGGNGNSVSLQPLSVSTQTGLDLSAGIGTLRLIPAAAPPPGAPPPPPPRY